MRKGVYLKIFKIVSWQVGALQNALGSTNALNISSSNSSSRESLLFMVSRISSNLCFNLKPLLHFQTVIFSRLTTVSTCVDVNALYPLKWQKRALRMQNRCHKDLEIPWWWYFLDFHFPIFCLTEKHPDFSLNAPLILLILNYDILFYHPRWHK